MQSLNPLLPLLILISLLPLVLRRRSPVVLAWSAVGLMGVALLSPTLRLSDGLPSPAAQIGTVAPWLGGVGGVQESASTTLGNPVQRDVTYQIQPWMLFLRSELRAGRLPQWNPFQYAGTPFWGNGQSAPLFPLHLLFVVLPLPVGWTILAWLRLMIGGLGAWMLARRLGLSSGACLLPALVYPASGMLAGFLLYPMANALALVPWVLWATEGMVRSSGGSESTVGLRSTVSPAVCIGFQALGGHPETVLHTMLLSGLFLLVRGTGGEGWSGRLIVWGRWGLGWALGLGMAAAHLLPLAFTLAESSRWQALATEIGSSPPPLTMLLAQSLRAVLPDLYGHPVDGTWFGPFNYMATAVYAGIAILPLAVVGLSSIRRSSKADGRGSIDRRWIAVFAMGLASWLAAYQLPGMRQLLDALPIVDRALHHRLIFGVVLALALLAGAGCDRWLGGSVRRPPRGLLIGVGSVALMLVISWLSYRESWIAESLIEHQTAWTLWAIAVLVLVVAIWFLGQRWRRRLLPLLLLVVAGDLVAAHGRLNPGLKDADLYPETPALRYLIDRTAEQASDRSSGHRIAAIGSSLRPNTATVFRLYDVRGDDTVKLATYDEAYGRYLGESHPNYFRPIDRWNESSRLFLDRLGVRWLLGPPGRDQPSFDNSAWSLEFDGADARIWQRTVPSSMVDWQGTETLSGERSLEVVDRAPGRWLIDWRSPDRATLSVSEAFAPGWEATSEAVGGSREARRNVSVSMNDFALIDLDVGPGAGRLELRYRTPGLVAGVAISLGSLLLIGCIAWTGLARPRASVDRPVGGVG